MASNSPPNPWKGRQSVVGEMDEGSELKLQLGDQQVDPRSWPSPIEFSEDSNGVPCSDDRNLGLDYSADDSELAFDSGGDEDCLILTTKMQERYYHMWTNVEKYGEFHDVKFEVGSEEKKITISAHRLVLAAKCLGFRKLFDQNRVVPRGELVFRVPDLDPVGFRQMLHFIYAGCIEVREDEEFSLELAFPILQAAKAFQVDELANLCFEFLQSKLRNENAVLMYRLAEAAKEECLVDIIRVYISNHIAEVFASEEFLHLSEDALCSLLKMDDWDLDEIDVFNHVKRWAISQRPELVNRDGQVEGQQLRDAMGQTFYNIRFPNMNGDKFLAQIFVTCPGFFGFDEVKDVIGYLCNPKKRDPSKYLFMLETFSARPRGKVESNESSSPSSVSTVLVDEIEDTLNHIETLKDGSFCNGIGLEDENLPPAKRVRFDENVTVNYLSSPSPEPVFVQTLNDFADVLAAGSGTEEIAVIEETLELTKLPTTRVYLPNLSKFHLDLEIRRAHSSGTVFKRFVKGKTTELHRFLFFDKYVDCDPPAEAQNVFTVLLKEKIDVLLRFNKCLVLSINHKDGTLLLNLVKDAQKIINVCGEFPLKKLCLSECQLRSLESLQRDLLEVIVIRRVTGLHNRTQFLQGCPSLRKVIWNDFGSEELRLGEDVFHKNPHIEKMTLTKSKLLLPTMPESWYLRELYLDNCDYQIDGDLDVLDKIPFIFPFLKRIQIYGTWVNSHLLYNILKIESIQWIFVWRLCFLQNEPSLEKEADTLFEFLADVFCAKVNTGKMAFILQRTGEVEPQPSTSSQALSQGPWNPFSPDKWIGKQLNGTEVHDVMNHVDFEHCAYNEFYSGYQDFRWAETTTKEAQTKKKEKR